MLTISRLGHRSIKYYNDTASHVGTGSRSAGGGLAEYYSESETRIPSWLVVGDKNAIANATGLNESALEGGDADTEIVREWLDDGRTPNGANGREFTEKSVHGFDLTFSAPKSVSLIRALTDDVAEKVLAAAHTSAVRAAMEYLHRHAGYTRVHNPITGNKDLQRLPGLVAIAYQHETSRCGDPHLHTHVIVPNRQPRADGHLVSLDSESLYHEAKAAGIIYQATLRHLLHAERGFEFHLVDPHTGMAEVAGVDPDCIKAWSQRSTRLREWARKNLVVVDGAPTAAQLAAAQRATRPNKPESLSWAELKAQWRADARGLRLDRDAHYRSARRTPHTPARRTRPSAHHRGGGARRQAHLHARRHDRTDRRTASHRRTRRTTGADRADRRRRRSAHQSRRAKPTIAKAARSSPSRRSSPRKNTSSTWPTRPTTARASTFAKTMSATCRQDSGAPSTTSRYHRSWSTLFKRLPGRGRLTPSRRCAPQHTGRTKRSSSSRRRARQSTKRCPTAPATTA